MKVLNLLVAMLLVLLLVVENAAAGTVYFLVTEWPGQEEHHDSFVLPLSDEGDIAHARDLVGLGAESAGETIVFADIVAGADNINRNIVAPGKPAWSWHLSNFEGFGDFGIELVDGWPSFVEQDVQGWIANTNPTLIGDPPADTGRIGFWNYTVTAELTGPANDLSILPAAVPLPAAFPVGLLTLAGVGVWKTVKPRIRL